MKTMKLGDIIQRVAEKDVMEKVKFGWSFVPKSEWKQKVRVLKEEKPKKSKKDTE